MSIVTTHIESLDGLTDSSRSWLAKHVEKLNIKGSVYLVEGAGLHKIGKATNVKSRLSSMAGGSPMPLTLIAVADGGCRLEARLHLLFSHVHSHGEWFRLTEDQVKTCIKLMGTSRLPVSRSETWQAIDARNKPRPIEGSCAGCFEDFVATDSVRWIDGKPFHRVPCWNTRRKQIQRARRARFAYVGPEPIGVPIDGPVPTR